MAPARSFSNKERKAMEMETKSAIGCGSILGLIALVALCAIAAVIVLI